MSLTARPAALHPRKAAAADLADIADTLALAFYDDPVVTWIIDDGYRRRELLPGFFGAIVASYFAHDGIYSVGDGIAAAVWAPPGADDDEDLLAVLGAALEEHADRLFEVLGLMEEKHPVDPHHYLFLLASRPGWQGRGIGSSLMAPVLETCDRDHVPAYLEATSERNKQLYIRHDFEVIDEIAVPCGPKMWPMWRSPK